MNNYNKKRDYKAWPISKSLPFYIFVLVHNIFLAVFSAWTCIGMFNAIKNSWPGLTGPNGLAGAADALCKLHGPRGLGSAAAYDTSGTAWGVTDRAIKLAGSQPDATDVGRIWNEGLAFYGSSTYQSSTKCWTRRSFWQKERKPQHYRYSIILEQCCACGRVFVTCHHPSGCSCSSILAYMP